MAQLSISEWHPSSSARAPRIASEVWEQYRSEIARLYIQESKSLDDVMAFMAKEHDFCPRYAIY